jgi:uncharacterized protein (UPF0261 family)
VPSSESEAWLRPALHEAILGSCEARGFETLLLDTSIGREPTLAPDISSEEVARLGGGNIHELRASRERAAGGICGMAAASTGPVKPLGPSPLVALTTFEFAEACGQHAIDLLEKRGYTVIPFHAQGIGDSAMEELIEQGLFRGVLDLVPAGVIEELLGGNRAAGPQRLEAAGRMGIPQVLTPCGFDRLSGGPLSRRDAGDPLWTSLRLAERKIFVPDELRVSARTRGDEVCRVAEGIARKLNASKGPVRFFIPTRGWSSLSTKGASLHEPVTDALFAPALREHLRPDIEVSELPMELDAPGAGSARHLDPARAGPRSWRRKERPVNYVSWRDAAHFANWLHNGQPTGGQDLTTTEDGSYFLDGKTTDAQLEDVVREPDATWVIPSEDEWYKAAYHKNDGVTGNHWNDPTSADVGVSNLLIDPDPCNHATFSVNQPVQRPRHPRGDARRAEPARARPCSVRRRPRGDAARDRPGRPARAPSGPCVRGMRSCLSRIGSRLGSPTGPRGRETPARG